MLRAICYLVLSGYLIGAAVAYNPYHCKWHCYDWKINGAKGIRTEIPNTNNRQEAATVQDRVGSFSTVNCAIAPRICKATKYRSLDGSCNHLNGPDLGMANTRYGRLLPPRYGDGISTPSRSINGDALPNPRLLSLRVFDNKAVLDPQFSLMNMQWGQVVTHDLSLQAGATPTVKHPTRCCTDDGRLLESARNSAACFPITLVPEDPLFSENGIECLNFVRTVNDFNVKCPQRKAQAEQLNIVTSYMDLSLLYGNSVEQNNEIREFWGGRMLLEERDGAEWLPLSLNATAECGSRTDKEVCYRGGDLRINQNVGLTLLHTILAREHNRIADELSELNTHWDDGRLFEEARKINIAQFQHITYYEWLPIFLGYENMLKRNLIYSPTDSKFINDFDADKDPSVLNSHATAAFRYFHSQINGNLNLVSELRRVERSIRLTDYFNRPGILEIEDNFDFLARGHSTQAQSLTDENFYRETEPVFQRRDAQFGFDFMAVDIQRSRDHGLASYNDYREFCGLGRAKNWSDFSDHIQNNDIEKLKALYLSPEDVDLIVGGSLEAHVNDSLTGPTFLCIISEQFHRTRVADRFFYENQENGFTLEQLNEIRKVSVARLLCDNGNDITTMQPMAFWLTSERNQIQSCSSIPKVNLTKWRRA